MGGNFQELFPTIIKIINFTVVMDLSMGVNTRNLFPNVGWRFGSVLVRGLNVALCVTGARQRPLNASVVFLIVLIY